MKAHTNIVLVEPLEANLDFMIFEEKLGEPIEQLFALFDGQAVDAVHICNTDDISLIVLLLLVSYTPWGLVNSRLPMGKRLFQPVTGFVRTTGCFALSSVPTFSGDPRGLSYISKPPSSALFWKPGCSKEAVRVISAAAC